MAFVFSGQEVSKQQVNKMLQLIEEDGYIGYSMPQDTPGRQGLWERLALTLNSIQDGCKKTGPEWEKYLNTRKLAVFAKHLDGEDLTAEEAKIFSIVTKSFQCLPAVPVPKPTEEPQAQITTGNCTIVIVVPQQCMHWYRGRRGGYRRYGRRYHNYNQGYYHHGISMEQPSVHPSNLYFQVGYGAGFGPGGYVFNSSATLQTYPTYPYHPY